MIEVLGAKICGKNKNLLNKYYDEVVDVSWLKIERNFLPIWILILAIVQTDDRSAVGDDLINLRSDSKRDNKNRTWSILKSCQSQTTSSWFIHHTINVCCDFEIFSSVALLWNWTSCKSCPEDRSCWDQTPFCQSLYSIFVCFNNIHNAHQLSHQRHWLQCGQKQNLRNSPPLMAQINLPLDIFLDTEKM